jgi:hypothetical protein
VAEDLKTGFAIDWSPIGEAVDDAVRLTRKSASVTIPVMATPQQGQAPASTAEARLKTVHATFMQTPKGSPEHDKAWGKLVDAIFINAK